MLLYCTILARITQLKKVLVIKKTPRIYHHNLIPPRSLNHNLNLRISSTSSRFKV